MTERDLILAEKQFLDHTIDLLKYMEVQNQLTLDYIEKELMPQVQTEREMEIMKLISNRINRTISVIGQKCYDHTWKLSKEIDQEYYRVIGDFRK